MIPADVRFKCFIAACNGYRRNIREDLSLEEQLIFGRIKILMTVMKTENTEVFAPGSYACFLEGVLKDYAAITIIYTCHSESWDNVLGPQTFLDLFMKGRGTIIVLKEEEKLLTAPHHKIDRIRCILTFNDGIKVTVDIGKVATSITGTRENILGLFTKINNNIWKVALVDACDMLFRSESIKLEDITNYFKNSINTYGSPFTLTWYAAKKINII